MSYETLAVYISCRELVMRAPAAAPFGLTYHAPDYNAFEFATRCGMRHRDPRDHSDPRTVAMRRDTADLIAKPCLRCYS